VDRNRSPDAPRLAPGRSLTNSDGLPVGWTQARLGDVVAEKVPQDGPGGDCAYIDISSVNNSTKAIRETKRISRENAPSRARQNVRRGDVLVSMTRPNLNAVAIVPQSLHGSIASTGFDVLRSAGSDPGWLFLIVRSAPFIDTMSERVQGALYPAVRPRDIRGYPIPLPPLAEQKRIVAKVEEVLARVNVARERLAKVPAILRQFRQAVLAAACSGGLTEDWRAAAALRPAAELLAAKPVHVATGARRHRAGRLWGAGQIPGLTQEERDSIPELWTWAKVRDLGESPDEAVQVGPMSMQSRDFVAQGVPVLNVGCVQWGTFDKSKLDFLPEDKARAFNRYRINEGDIVFTRSGTVGRCAVASGGEKHYLMTFHLPRVRPARAKCLPEYLAAVFRGAKHIRRQTEEGAIGSTRAGFNTNLLASLDVPLPSLEEQHEILRRVDALMKLADAVEHRLSRAFTLAERMIQATLAKAFRGELVPTEAELAAREGREFETAEQLLARVRAARESQSSKRSRRASGNGRTDQSIRLRPPAATC